MKTSTILKFGSAAALAFAMACGAPVDSKGDESSILDGDKVDSFQKPTDHGAIAFSTATKGELTKKEQFHTWTFSLSGPASLSLRTTGQTKNAKKVDTVLYLYKKTPTGTWGSYVVRNDDDSKNAPWSKITRDLEVGDYRVLVKSYDASVTGKFALFVDCSGIGCQPPAPPASECAFGDAYNAMPENMLVNKTKLYATSPIDELTGKQIIAALHASSHDDVTTVAEAFAAADQGEVNRVTIYDTQSARAFTAYEYGAGDNSYGRYFVAGTLTAVADIHDGEIMNCTVAPAQCLFGQTYHEIFDTDRLVYTITKIKDGNSLTATEKTQLVRAVQVAYEDASDVASAFESVDQNEINFVHFTDRANNAAYVAFEYGAGDNSYGAIFPVGDAQVAASIHDGDLYECRFWR